MFLKKIRELNNSLLVRLTLLYAVAFTLLSSIGFLLFYYRIYAVTMDTLDIELRAEATNYVALMKKSGLESIKAAIADEGKFEDAEDGFYRLLNANGATIVSTDMTAWDTYDHQKLLTKFEHTGAAFEIETLTGQGRSNKVRAIVVGLSPDFVLQIGESLEEVENYLAIFLKLFSVLVLCLIVVSTLIGWFIARRATIDMQEVTNTAEEISKGVYERRVQTKGRLKEIERLGNAFNYMLDRIHFLLRSMKEINDNIAHDLRSPLARIRGIAEMNLLKENSIKSYQEMAASTIEECDALMEMINTMLDITEAEAGVNGPQFETIDVAVLIKEACELFNPLAQRKKIILIKVLPETLEFKTDRKKLQRIITNLIENAIKYSPEKQQVTITAESINDEVSIVIKDAGIGIAERDLPHIFERFYRCDRSRSQGGVGLGLSLVKAYVESINGRVWVESIIERGSCFTIRLKH